MNKPLRASKAKSIIAVIDDEQKWLKVYKRMFKDSNYLVDTYSDPQTFLNTITEHPDRYVGIICDIKMPKLSGHQVFEEIKNNRETQDVPFLIVSGVLTQEQNLSKIQGTAYVSKLDDELRARIFEELIEVIENWPKVKQYLRSKNVSEERIDFFCQFFINYQKFFNEILRYINAMEEACVASDTKAISEITKQCTDFMDDLHDKNMSIISLLQESSQHTGFMRKMCERGRSSLNMIQNFQLFLAEETTSNEEFQDFLKECRENLEKIVIGTEKGFCLRRY